MKRCFCHDTPILKNRNCSYNQCNTSKVNKIFTWYFLHSLLQRLNKYSIWLCLRLLLGEGTSCQPSPLLEESLWFSYLHQWHFNLVTKAVCTVRSWALWFLNVYGYICSGKFLCLVVYFLYLSLRVGENDDVCFYSHLKCNCINNSSLIRDHF